jgi:hypothetical protein
MKYLINKETKEHKFLTYNTLWSSRDWTLVQADSEGWIAHTGTECPLPDDVMCAIKLTQGEVSDYELRADSWYWHKDGDLSGISHYRPILELAQEPEQTDFERQCAELKKRILRIEEKESAEKEAEIKHVEIKEAELKRMMLLDRLKAAHEAAQAIPDLEAQLREVLAGMGYDLVSRSPFVDAGKGGE